MNQIQSATQSVPNHTQAFTNAKQCIAFIQACWHKDIVDQGRISFTNTLIDYGLDENQIDVSKYQAVLRSHYKPSYWHKIATIRSLLQPV